MKVNTFNNNIAGTVMDDQMAHSFNLNKSLDEKNKQLEKQQKKLEEQIKIAEMHNMKQQLNNTTENNDDHAGTSNLKKQTNSKYKKMRELPLAAKIPKNLSINSVCSSNEGLNDNNQNATKTKLVNVTKKRKQSHGKVKEFSIKIFQGNKLASQKRVKYKIAPKPKKPPTKNDAKNLDKETDEKDYVWEIERDWKLTYFRRNKVLKKGTRANLTVIGLENYRKQYEKEGELLMRYKDGRRDWTFAIDAKHDAKDEMYNEAMQRFKLTDDQFKFGLSKFHEIAINKQKELLKQQLEDNANKQKEKGNFFILYVYIFIY
jgi:hypothetical protein